MKKIIIATILVMLISSFSFAITPAQRITEDCGLYIEANHINKLFSQLENYAKIFGMPIQKGQLKQMVSRNVFQSRSIPGINLAKKIGLFFLFKKNDLRNKPHFVIMIPVRNWNTYRTKVLPKLKLGGSTLSKKLGDYSVIASSEIGMRKFNESPRLENAKIFQKANLNFFINFEIVGNLMGKIADKMQNTKYYNKTGQENQMQAQILDLYKNMLKSIINITAGLKIDNKGLEISYNMKTNPNTDIGRIISKSQNGELNTISYLPQNTIAMTTGRGDIKTVANFYEKIFINLINNSQYPGIKIQKEIYQVMFSFLKLHFKNEISLAMLPTANKKLSFVAVAKINNPDNALKRYKKLVTKFNSSQLFKKAAQKGVQLKVRLQEKISSYNNTPIHKLSLKMAIPKKMDDAGRAGTFLRVFQKLLTINFFHHRGYEIITFGTDNTASVKKMIRVAKQKNRSFLKSAAYRKIKSSYGDKSKNSVFYLSLPKVALELIQFASRFSKDEAMLQTLKLLKNLPQQTGGIYGYSAFKDNNTSGQILISKQEIKNIINFYMMLMKAKERPAGRYNKYRR